MRDSNVRDDLEAKRERNRQQRLKGIRRWVDYVKANPPEKWGEQQNRLVNSQLDAARAAGVSAEQHRRVERAANDRFGEDDE